MDTRTLILLENTVVIEDAGLESDFGMNLVSAMCLFCDLRPVSHLLSKRIPCSDCKHAV